MRSILMKCYTEVMACPLFSAKPSSELLYTLSPFHWFELISIPAWTSDHMPNKMWDEITFPFPNFNGANVEVWGWIRNFITHFIMGCNYLSMLGFTRIKEFGLNFGRFALQLNWLLKLKILGWISMLGPHKICLAPLKLHRLSVKLQ